MEEKQFCKRCGIKIDKGILGLGGSKSYEFQDGIYCEKCAKITIEQRRKQ